MIFRRATLLSGLLLGLLILTWGFHISYVREGDIREIKERIRDWKESKSTTLFSATEQTRKGVVKDLWISQENKERLHHRIHSRSSLLMIVPKEDGKVDLIEKLQDLSCWMQDKLYPGPFQQARFLQASEGYYRYSSQAFLAQSVALSVYRLPSHDLPTQVGKEKPFLKGIAKDVSFSLSGGAPQFNAQQFKAELNSSEDKKS